MLIRKLARPLLASVFIADGVDALLNPEAHTDDARRALKRTKAALPNSYAQAIPNNPELVVRVSSGVKVGAGALFAFGKAPRLAATALALVHIPTMLTRNAFWETQEAGERTAKRNGLITDTALLGALSLATVDTAGKPGLAWRATDASKRVNKKVSKAIDAANPAAQSLGDRAADVTESFADKVKDASEKVADAYDDVAPKVAAASAAFAGTAAAKGQDWFSVISERLSELADSTEDVRADAKQRTSKLLAAAQDSATKATEAGGKQSERAAKQAEKLLATAEKRVAQAKKQVLN